MNARPSSLHDLGSAVRLQPTLLIGNDRAFYTGPLRRSLKMRRLGALSIYAAPDAPFEITVGDRPRRTCTIAAVPAYERHRVAPPAGPIWNLLVEPESIDPRIAEAIVESCNGASACEAIECFRRADRSMPAAGPLGGFTTEEFDLAFFGTPLPGRRLDIRIAEVLRLLRQETGEASLSAEDCARAVDLSASRLCHLFRRETGVSFRACRMWRRARRFLDLSTGDASLTDVALSLGYPDSSHFSHSIRRTFGMQPGAMRAGARNLLIMPGAGYRLCAA